MGGSSSQPIEDDTIEEVVQQQTQQLQQQQQQKQAAATTSDKPFRVIENREPYPGSGASSADSLSIPAASQCNKPECKFVVPQNQSTSVVTLTRRQPAAAGATTNKETTTGTNPTAWDPKDTEIVKNPCWEGEEDIGDRVRKDANTVEVKCYQTCRDPGLDDDDPWQERTNAVERNKCEYIGVTERGANKQSGPRKFRPALAAPKNMPSTTPAATTAKPSARYAADKKLFITPDKPFEIKYGGATHTIRTMAIYRPCPYRIENMQADAVLSLNDYSDPEATIVILIPLSAKIRYGKPGDFVGRVMQNVNGFVMNESTKEYVPLTIPVGHDWQLTNVLESTQDEDLDNTVVGGFFTWRNVRYVETVKSLYKDANDVLISTIGWRIAGEGARTVVFKDTVGISYLTSTYLQLLPYAPSSESAPPIASDDVKYSPTKCTTCSNGPAASFEDAQAFLNQTSEVMTPKAIAFLVGTFLVAALTILAIYFALDSALGGNGRFFMSGPVSLAGWLAAPRPAAPPAQ